MSTRVKNRKRQNRKAAASATPGHADVPPIGQDSQPSQADVGREQQSVQVPGFGEAEPLSDNSAGSRQPVGAPV